MDEYSIIKHPISTEKSIRLIESENKLIFAVDEHATKKQIKAAVEKMFSCQVEAVNTLRNAKSEKRAYVKFSRKTPALDIATTLGLM
ncbi:MAG TPA: 50S ribosomal protein L23 [Candidatus Nanoarchaeia archaeon]|nr:50S ribosomal protein L23 [Candidatus Nanoarchaeia archaeon]